MDIRGVHMDIHAWIMDIRIYIHASMDPLLNYPPLYPLLRKTPKNRFSVLVLSRIQSSVLIPLVLSSPATVTEYREQSTHDIF